MPGETYNVGSGVEASIEEIADRVLELTGKPESLKTIVPDRPGHDRRYLLDSSKLRRELGWGPEIGFEDGLRETVEWYAANRAWWEPLSERLQVERSTPPGRQDAQSERRDEAGSQALAPVRELAAHPLAAQDRVRGTRGRTAELSGRDPADAATQAGLLEDRLGELGPRAVARRRDMADAIRKLEDFLRRLREMPDEGRRAALVVDDRHLVLLAPSSSIVRTKFCPVQPKSHDERTIQPSRTSRSPSSFVRP